MHKYDPYYQAIDEIIRTLQLDLIGPGTEDEILENEYPLNRYHLGILYPQAEKERTADSQQDSAEAEKEYSVGELEEIFEDQLHEMKETVSMVNAYMPSAMAVTVLLPQDAELRICFRYGRYQLTKDSHPEQFQTKFNRMQMQIEKTVSLPASTGSFCAVQNDDLALFCHIRAVYRDYSRLVTVSVTNTHCSSGNRMMQNQTALFQCSLSLSTPSVFLPIRRTQGMKISAEDAVNEMLYRNVGQIACGHGCSVSYSREMQVNQVNSTFLPHERLCQMIPASLSDDGYLHMCYWRTADRNAAYNALQSFVLQYQAWRQGLAKTELPQCYSDAAAVSVMRIDLCIRRIQNGIETLYGNDLAWEAFLLMQEAMLIQRLHTKQGVSAESVKWYPFQLAYILQIIPDIVNPESEFRNTADLLWFPTGGGKTEAYLGVAAFVIFYRRLLHRPQQDGTAIIMRYTLRLLTIQQFERATALICACEVLRRERKIPGGEISIGLWIGSAMTPNKLETAKDIIEQLQADQTKQIYEGNPVQITKCPWCGASIALSDYSVGDYLNIRCGSNPECDFHKKLPVYLVDEDVYQYRPTLVLSTIDKFARLAWEANAGSILGNGSPLPPDLIIQDELHLISGPLGTITGVYEAAVDEICKANGGNPKIIASTATARNAGEQIRILYNREMLQFPPNGIDYDDSFFAVAANEYDRPARTYLGVCSIGGSAVNLLIRIYALSFYLKLLFQKKGLPEQVVDQFFTTVGYFNTIKDLGTSSTVIEDRITAELRHLICYQFRSEAEQYGLTVQDIKPYYAHSELTSRRSSQEIRQVLDRLSRTSSQDGCYAYVLSSNMLSVGIDIDRLGFMTVFGQPKSNAEYIQATSRVGRSAPGIVIAIYHGMRSRDKSHYEQFPYYHRTFYQYVEANSVTSYSARAIEKAMHCAFIAMLRHTVGALNSNASAGIFSSEMPAVQAVRKKLTERAKLLSPETAEFAGQWLDYFMECWENLRDASRGKLVYYDYLGAMPSLMISAEDAENPEEIPRILNTMRDVQPQSDVYIIRR